MYFYAFVYSTSLSVYLDYVEIMYIWHIHWHIRHDKILKSREEDMD